MAIFLSPIGNSNAVSSSGAPLSGGKIFTYLAGTSTPAATFTDSSGATPQQNPITLNTLGLPSSPIWMTGAQALKFIVKDALGNTLATYDGIYGIGDPTPSASSATSFRNRLHNGNFPINQRMVSGTVTLAAGAYGHDRWKAGAGGCTYTFAAFGNFTVITITAGSLLQVVEGSNVEGGVYTLSNQGTALARYGINGAAPSGTYVTASAASPLQLTTANANQTVSVEFSTGTLDRIQLEPGTVATPFERRPLSVELALCQWYYRRIGGISGTPLGSGTMISATESYVFGSFPPMRTAPTGSAITAGVGFTQVTNGVTSSTGTSHVIAATPTGYTLDTTGNASAVANGAVVVRTANANQFLEFTADL